MLTFSFLCVNQQGTKQKQQLAADASSAPERKQQIRAYCGDLGNQDVPFLFFFIRIFCALLFLLHNFL
jgi:hypothetical protein